MAIEQIGIWHNDLIGAGGDKVPVLQEFKIYTSTLILDLSLQ